MTKDGKALDSLHATCSHRMRSSLYRKFLNIAFTRFWRGDRIGAQGGRVPGLNIKWYGVCVIDIDTGKVVHNQLLKPPTPITEYLTG